MGGGQERVYSEADVGGRLVWILLRWRLENGWMRLKCGTNIWRGTPMDALRFAHLKYD